jgi:ketosteroid isomerase-like protein
MMNKTELTSSILIILVLLFLSLSYSGAAKADTKSKFDDEISTTLNNFAERYNKKDIKGIMKLFANDKEVTAIGLCEKQAGMGPEGIKAVFEKDLFSYKGNRSITFKNVAVGNYGFIAWLSTDVYPYAILDDGRKVPGVKARLTAVLRKSKGKWKFLQMHVSVPADVEYKVTSSDQHASEAKR